MLRDYVEILSKPKQPTLEGVPRSGLVRVFGTFPNKYAAPNIKGGEEYFYAALYGEASHFITSSGPMAITSNVLQIKILTDNPIVRKCLKFLLRRRHEDREVAIAAINSSELFHPPSRMVYRCRDNEDIVQTHVNQDCPHGLNDSDSDQASEDGEFFLDFSEEMHHQCTPRNQSKEFRDEIKHCYQDHKNYNWDVEPFVEVIFIPPCVETYYIDTFVLRGVPSINCMVFKCRDAEVYVYRGFSVIETKGNCIGITEDHMLFNGTKVYWSLDACRMLAELGLPVFGKCGCEIRNDLLNLASCDILGILPQPIAEEIYPYLRAEFDWDVSAYIEIMSDERPDAIIYRNSHSIWG
jgi:hypothetical protein